MNGTVRGKLAEFGKCVQMNESGVMYSSKELIIRDDRRVRLSIYKKSNESKDKIYAEDDFSFSRKRVYKDFRLFLDNKMGIHSKRLLRGVPNDIETFEATVFQLAGCNLRCWYCYVDDELMSPKNGVNSTWVSIAEMIDVLDDESEALKIIDLSGGQPDMAPEWCLWVMEELERRSLRGRAFIWMDDNLLTTDNMFEQLSSQEVSYIAHYPLHSRVGCFKGFNEASFRFNTGSEVYTLEDQFKNFEKLYNAGFELYAYITLTPEPGNYNYKEVEDFIMRIMSIHPMLPLRVIPIEIKPFHATKKRMSPVREQSLLEQFDVYKIWDGIMESIFGDLRDIPYETVKIFEKCNLENNSNQ